jgi:tRNA (guanine-N7-)-methyltransferase
MKKLSIQDYLPDTSRILFDPEELDRPLNLVELFGSIRPVEIEVGCGKGRFLIESAESNPERGYIGLEYAKAYARTITLRSARQRLTNLRLARTEATWFFEECLGDASLDGFHLLYPDPWPKTRHHKRRLIQHSFLRELRRILKPGAQINIATDHRGYYDWMMEHFAAWKGTFLLDFNVIDSPGELRQFSGRTNYEIKFAEEGRPLHFIKGIRTSF